MIAKFLTSAVVLVWCAAAIRARGEFPRGEAFWRALTSAGLTSSAIYWFTVDPSRPEYVAMSMCFVILADMNRAH